MPSHAAQFAVASPQVPDLGQAGRLYDPEVSSGERTYVLWMHLSSLIGFLVLLGPFAFLIPLVMWQTRKTAGVFLDDHGREIMNLWVTGAGLFVIGLVTGVGMLLWLIWSIVQAVNIVRACIATSESQYFRYPMLVRLLS